MTEKRATCCGRATSAKVATNAASSVVVEPREHGTSTGAVRVVYLGGRNVHFRGASGTWYHFGPSRRRGELAKRDLPEALERSDFMLEPNAKK